MSKRGISQTKSKTRSVDGNSPLISLVRFPRAMRSLGRKHLLLGEHHFKNSEKEEGLKNYRLAIEAFEKSLALNSRQPDAWFSLGCAAQQAEDYSVAVRAFRRKVDMDQEVASHESLFDAFLHLIHRITSPGTILHELTSSCMTKERPSML